jgi:hypothetical protein
MVYLLQCYVIYAVLTGPRLHCGIYLRLFYQIYYGTAAASWTRYGKRAVDSRYYSITIGGKVGSIEGQLFSQHQHTTIHTHFDS